MTCRYDHVLNTFYASTSWDFVDQGDIIFETPLYRQDLMNGELS